MESSALFDTEVLVAGAGPVGLTAALELRRRGIDVVVVDKLIEPPEYAKAVGIQPRTLEVWDAMGVVRAALDRSTPMLGQIVYVNGQQTARLELNLPRRIPYRFVSIPQYEVERVLAGALAERGTRVQRGTALVSFEQDSDRVLATLHGPAASASHTITSRYLIGCDGAHSLVRKGMGARFEGDAFPEQYMLVDVEVDWSIPPGYGLRAMRQENGATVDLLVCIPLPGRGRYRMSTFVAPDLAGAPPEAAEIAHGFGAGRRPELEHIQAVLDRLAPEPVTARNLRWSSVFRISHRLADRYRSGRVFIAGDAAHIHPPTGAQGMNTGIQDAFNLGWKLALAVRGRAAEHLLDSYHAERHPIGEEVVDRTVRLARAGIGAGETDAARAIAREAQLLLHYRHSALVDGSDWADGPGPPPGERAADATGLEQPALAFRLRLHALFRHPGHTLILWAPDESVREQLMDLAGALRDAWPGWLRTYVVLDPQAVRSDVVAGMATAGYLLVDTDRDFADAYGLQPTMGSHAIVVRPDGYLAYRGAVPTFDGLSARLRTALSAGPAKPAG